MTENINRYLLFTLFLGSFLSGKTLTVELEKDTSLSDLVAQGIDVRHRIPRGRQASFRAESVYFKGPDGFEIKFEKGECIIRFTPDQKIWYLNYYERTFTDVSVLEERLQDLYRKVKDSKGQETVYEKGVGVSISGSAVPETVVRLRDRPSDKREGWLHLSFSPRKLTDERLIEYGLRDAKIDPPFEYPDHDMTPVGNLLGSTSKKEKLVSDGVWRSPAQPGTTKRVRNKVDLDVEKVPKKNYFRWSILGVVALGVVWLVLKGFFQRNEESG